MRLSYFFNRYLVLLLVLWFITRSFQALEGLYSTAYHLFSLETLFVLYLYAWFNQMIYQNKYQAWIAALPIVLAYLVFDIFFIAYGRFFHLSEFEELPELLAVIPALQGFIFASLILVPLLIFVRAIDYRKKQIVLLTASPLFLLIFIIAVLPHWFLQSYSVLNKPAVTWSDQFHTKDNGRFMVFMHRQATRRQALLTSRHQLNWTAYRQEIQAKVTKLKSYKNQENIHLIVLESFFNPNDFDAVQYSKDPTHPDYSTLFTDKINASISPVFGGSTAQAEFEALCGYPAFSLYSNVEFNAFGGANVACLPGLLQQAGYRSIASNGFRPDFFNTVAGYNGIGFKEIYFPAELSKGQSSYYSTGQPEDEDFFMADKTLFDANLKMIAEHIQTSEQPLFNYILSIYGHFPHQLHENQKKTIEIIQTPYKDSYLENLSNQYYYRTEAIAKYSQALIKLDPNSTIIFVSDHLPPLTYGKNSYKRLGYNKDIYHMPLLVIKAGQVQRLPVLHHYDIPDLIQNYLSEGKHCQQQKCNLESEQKSKIDYYQDYQRFMAHALFTAP